MPSAESGITLAFERAKVVRQAGHEPQLRICLAVRGVPPDLRLEGRGVAQSWEWSGVKIERGGEFGEDGFAALAPAMRALRLEPSRVDPAWFLANSDRRVRIGLLGNPVMPEGVGLSVQCEMRPAYVARMEREAPSYSLMAHLEFFRPEVIAEEPLALGGHLDRGRSHVRVAGIERREDSMRVTLIEYTPIFDWRSPGRYIGTKFSGGETGLEYFLVNRTRGDASRGQEIGVQTARFGTVAITWRTLVFRTPRTWTSAGWVQPVDWFRALTLAKISNRRVAETRQELRVGELDVTGER